MIEISKKTVVMKNWSEEGIVLLVAETGKKSEIVNIDWDIARWIKSVYVLETTKEEE